MFLRILLVFVPLSIGAAFFKANPLLVFAMACVAIIPLADLLAKATERVASVLGPTLGGLLNATLGNAPELIIGGFALSKGLQSVVKSSIAGSILMNLLLLLGLAMVAGGMGRVKQTFNKTSAGMSAALLNLASIGLIVPTLFHISSPAQERRLGLEISVLLFGAYLLSLVFTLRTHKQLFAAPAEEPDEPHEEKSKVKLGPALAQLGGIAIVLAIVSEIMTDSLDPAIDALGFSETFAGVVVLAALGNVAQLIAAIRFARADKMDLAMGTTVGAATQAALAVAPILVFASLLMSQPMDLLFSTFEVFAIALAVLVTGQLTRDGESNWMEGAMLVTVYLIFALGFFFVE